MHNFSGKWDPQILPWICFHLADKKATFFSKDRTCFEKERTDKPRPPPQQTNQTTNQPRKKETNQPTNLPSKQERKKETNKATNQPTCFYLFHPKKHATFMFCTLVLPPSSRTPSTIPPPRLAIGTDGSKSSTRGLDLLHIPARRGKWQRNDATGGDFPSENHPENRWFQPWKGLKSRDFLKNLCVFSVFWMVCCLEFSQISFERYQQYEKTFDIASKF